MYKNVEYGTSKGLRKIDINVHLQRKSLKYMLELTVEKLDLPDQHLQEFKQFLQKNSPYYDDSDTESNYDDSDIESNYDDSDIRSNYDDSDIRSNYDDSGIESNYNDSGIGSNNE
ncbi:hypothetical protein [uncultured Endozoicomonas sp.]|uniref:hypothetical protein n=1 Tax=uncultured Endozoicomonas sp. TaxID=432652 RepID=UPI00263130A0|nr:hypothetical protein [uncultured Endozoicomonas sp.]